MFEKSCVVDSMQNGQLVAMALAGFANFNSSEDFMKKKNNSGQWRSAYYEYFIRKNFSAMETTVTRL